MLVLRLGSTSSSMEISNMPPHKKMKRDVTVTPVVDLEAESETEKAASGECDWRDRCKSLRDMYSYALENGILTDVKLVVGEPATEFQCHRVILAVGSSVFEAMFYGPLAEKGDSVRIPDMDPEGFRHLLRFLYTSEYEGPQDENAFKIYFAADKYCVSKLKKLCESTLCSCELNAGNVWTFFENSLLLNSEAIKQRCLDALRHHGGRWMEDSSFLDISLNTLQTLLRLDELNVSEQTLCLKVVRWAVSKSEKEGAESFENTIKPLLPSIRFGALTAKEFIRLQNESRLGEVLSDRDGLSILQHLILPEQCALPDWCCSKQRHLFHCDFSIERIQSTVRPSSACKSKIFGPIFEDPPYFSPAIDTTTASSSSSSSSDSSTDDSSSDF